MWIHDKGRQFRQNLLKYKNQRVSTFSELCPKNSGLFGGFCNIIYVYIKRSTLLRKPHPWCSNNLMRRKSVTSEYSLTRNDHSDQFDQINFDKWLFLIWWLVGNRPLQYDHLVENGPLKSGHLLTLGQSFSKLEDIN